MLHFSIGCITNLHIIALQAKSRLNENSDTINIVKRKFNSSTGKQISRLSSAIRTKTMPENPASIIDLPINHPVKETEENNYLHNETTGFS